MVLDFWRRKSADEIQAETLRRLNIAAPSAPAQTAKPLPRRESVEELIEDPRWGFRPDVVTETSRQFSHEAIQDAAAIYSAQQMRRIADDIEAIRKHLTRLQLVTPPTENSDG